MTRTLLYGGSFDPPHRGHVEIPHAAMLHLQFDRVLYVPAYQSPHKTDARLASIEHRLAMLRIAISDCPWAEISTIELDRGGISYTIDTIESLQHDEDEIRLLIGADQWEQFERWHRWEDILELAEPVVMPRAGFELDDTVVLPIEPFDAIATDIRTRINNNQAIDDLVLEGVAKYIAQHGLYL